LDGGINENDIQRQQHECADAENITFANGYVEVRPGIFDAGLGTEEDYLTTNGELINPHCAGMYIWSDNYNRDHTLAVKCYPPHTTGEIPANQYYFYIDGVANTVSATTMDNGKSEYTRHGFPRFTFAVINYNLYCADGINFIYKISFNQAGDVSITFLSAEDGIYSDVTTYLKEIPSTKYICAHEGRLCLAGDPLYPNRVTCSRPDNPSVFVPDEYLDISPDYDSKITGLVSFNQQLLIFTDQSIWASTGIASGSLSQVAYDLGASCQQAIKVAYGGVFFLSKQGLCFFDGGNVTNLSNIKLFKTFKSLDTSRFNEASMNALKESNEIWVAVPEKRTRSPHPDDSSARNIVNAIQLVIVYNYAANTFTKYKFNGLNIRYLGYFAKDGTDNPNVKFCLGSTLFDTTTNLEGNFIHRFSPCVKRAFDYQDSSLNSVHVIENRWISGDIFADDAREKVLRNIYVDIVPVTRYYSAAGQIYESNEYLNLSAYGSWAFSITHSITDDDSNYHWDNGAGVDKWHDGQTHRWGDYITRKERVNIKEERTTKNFRIFIRSFKTAGFINLPDGSAPQYPLKIKSLSVTYRNKGMR